MIDFRKGNFSKSDLSFGQKISYDYAKLILREIEENHSEINDKISLALLGDGSEVPGFDDEISHDHNFAPRLVLLTNESLRDEDISLLKSTLSNISSPDKNFPLLSSEYRSSLIMSRLEEYILDYLRIEYFPENEKEWLVLDEQLLFEITSGLIFFDAKNQLLNQISKIDYYPESVANYLLYIGFLRLSESAAIERAIRRKDQIATSLYQNQFIYFAIKSFHVIKRKYCPYRKWMGRNLLELENGEQMHNLVSELITTNSLKVKRNISIQILQFLAEEANISITKKTNSKIVEIDFPWSEVITELKNRVSPFLLQLPMFVSPRRFWGMNFDIEGWGGDTQSFLEHNLNIFIKK